MTRRIAVGLGTLALLLSLPHAVSANEGDEGGEGGEGEEHTECADYVSSGEGDEPLTGYLLGSKTVRRTKSADLDAGLEAGNGVVKGSVGGTGGWAQEETYDVGAYRTSDGNTIYLRCDDYTAAN